MDKSVTAVVIQGLAEHKDTLGAPLCPCRHYDDKAAEAAQGFWNCPCVPMRERKVGASGGLQHYQQQPGAAAHAMLVIQLYPEAAHCTSTADEMSLTTQGMLGPQQHRALCALAGTIQAAPLAVVSPHAAWLNVHNCFMGRALA